MATLIALSTTATLACAGVWAWTQRAIWAWAASMLAIVALVASLGGVV